MQAGASLTLGAALISLFYPVRVGGLGYGILLYTLYKSKLPILPPALLFIPIFLIATDFFSLFVRGARGRRSSASTGETDAATQPAKRDAATAKPAAKKRAKRT
jgi:hypothetical protein